MPCCLCSRLWLQIHAVKQSASELEALPLGTHNGTPVYVRDIAEVREAGGARFGAVTRDGREVVFGMALQRIGENAKKVAAAVREKINTIQQTLPSGVKIIPVYDRTDLVDHAVSAATRTLVEGALLVAIVLFLFLGEIRSAVVVVVALPLAILIAFVLMQQIGLSANLMSLAGLSVGIGMMIDGAIVLVENVHRLLAGAPDSGARLQVIRHAAREVMKPVAFAILIIIVVFLPLFSLSDVEGKLFRPMALSIVFAMAGSLVLTMTVIPVLASMLLRPGPERETLLVRWAKRAYVPVLNASLAHKGVTFGAAAVALIASAVVLPFLGREFLPQLQEGALMFRVTTIASTSLDESIAVSEHAQRTALRFPEVVTAVALIGRAERGEAEDVNRIELLVNLKDRSQWPTSVSYQDLSKAMRDAFEDALPTAVISVGQPIQNRVEELVSGVRAPLSLRIFGDDLAELDRISAAVKEVLEKVPGVADLSLEANKGKPQITIAVNQQRAARYGISADEVLDAIRVGIGGKSAGVVLDGPKQFNVMVRLKPEFRNSLAAIEKLPLRNKDGALVPLSQVADITTTEGYAFVRHDDLRRNSVVQMDVRGRDVNRFVEDAQAAIAREVKLPTGYVLQWGGAFENQQRAMARLALIVPLTIGLIFVLLYTTFNSAALAGLIIANVPFAMVGGILALLLTGQYLSVPSIIGFIAVFGVAMLNGIVLVSFINEQIKEGKSVGDAVRAGALMRLRPVLMTASVAILGLMPMLVSRGVGAETQRPLATVVVGGLLSSTALTLLLLPLLYEWIRSRSEHERKD